MKTLNLFFVISIAFFISGCAMSSIKVSEKAVAIPLAGNSYVTENKSAGDVVSQKGIEQWRDPKTVISTYFKTSKAGNLNLFIRAKSEKTSSIKIEVAGKQFSLKLSNTDWDTIPVGTIFVANPGYVQVAMQGLTIQGDQFADISDLIIDGEAAAEPLAFVKDFEPYWGRRGPSVHMKYTLPKDKEVAYFYNEVTVPIDQDINGSYYMANGFGEGYFGMQANSDTERRVLFSVWSPFDTQDPKSIPEDQQIKMLRRGKDVHIGEFGNEGSGGQSYLVYPWIAGNKYQFLSHVMPDKKGNTIYTAYFFAPEENEWRLIASFLRPKTSTWYTNAHSFLENFIPEQGHLKRNVLFENQWACTSAGEWIELTEGMFTHDATASAGVRMDYAGGIDENRFYLQNCGFFNESTPFKSMFTRTSGGSVQPVIDFESLKTIQ